MQMAPPQERIAGATRARLPDQLRAARRTIHRGPADGPGPKRLRHEADQQPAGPAGTMADSVLLLVEAVQSIVDGYCAKLDLFGVATYARTQHFHRQHDATVELISNVSLLLGRLAGVAPGLLEQLAEAPATDWPAFRGLARQPEDTLPRPAGATLSSGAPALAKRLRLDFDIGSAGASVSSSLAALFADPLALERRLDDLVDAHKRSATHGNATEFTQPSPGEGHGPGSPGGGSASSSGSMDCSRTCARVRPPRRVRIGTSMLADHPHLQTLLSAEKGAGPAGRPGPGAPTLAAGPDASDPNSVLAARAAGVVGSTGIVEPWGSRLLAAPRAAGSAALLALAQGRGTPGADAAPTIGPLPEYIMQAQITAAERLRLVEEHLFRLQARSPPLNHSLFQRIKRCEDRLVDLERVCYSLISHQPIVVGDRPATGPAGRRRPAAGTPAPGPGSPSAEWLDREEALILLHLLTSLPAEYGITDLDHATASDAVAAALRAQASLTEGDPPGTAGHPDNGHGRHQHHHHHHHHEE